MEKKKKEIEEKKEMWAFRARKRVQRSPIKGGKNRNKYRVVKGVK